MDKNKTAKILDRYLSGRFSAEKERFGFIKIHFKKNKMRKLLFWGIIILFSVPLLAQPEVDSTRRFQLEHVKNKERAILASVGSFQRLNSYVNPLAASGIAAGVTITGEQFKSWGVQSSEYQYNAYVSLVDANQMMGMSLSYSRYWHWRVYARADKRLFIYAGMGANLDINPEMSLLSGGNNDISFKEIGRASCRERV